MNLNKLQLPNHTLGAMCFALGVIPPSRFLPGSVVDPRQSREIQPHDMPAVALVW
jgi:hypothetical protein